MRSVDSGEKGSWRCLSHPPHQSSQQQLKVYHLECHGAVKDAQARSQVKAIPSQQKYKYPACYGGQCLTSENSLNQSQHHLSL